MELSKENLINNNTHDNQKNEKYKYKSFNNLINTFYNEEIEGVNFREKKVLPENEKVKIETKIEYDKFINEMKLEIKIGNKRMYKLRDLAEFYNRMTQETFFKYGEKLEFVHIRENFEKDSQELLDFILKYAEVMRYTNSNDKYNYYYLSPINKSSIILGENSIDEIFDILKEKKVSFNYEHENTELKFIERNPGIEFDLEKINKNELILKPDINIFALAVFKGRKYNYLLYENKFYRCDKEFSNTTLKVIKTFRENYTSEMLLKKENLKEFYTFIMPKINGNVKVKGMKEEELELYKPQELAVKVFLDFDEKNYLTADIKFCYNDIEFNPFDGNEKVPVLRNELEENRTLNIFKKSGFMFDVNNIRLIIPDDEKIYSFLYNDIDMYMQKFEVLVTDNFKTKDVREPKLGTIGIKIENNLLNVDLSKLNISPDEIQSVMEKYKLKKKFYRLKDGSFLNLKNNEDIDFLETLSAGIDIDYKELSEGSIKLPVNRTLYLNELLKKFKLTNTNKNSEYRQVIDDLDKDNCNENFKIPKRMENILRDYQKKGFNWLKTLEQYNLGGILADDMGLGKTIQILTLILSYIEENGEKTSIVISPSSLALNWLQEIKKFAPEINAKVISGNAIERKKSISELDKYDLIITSYDLLKRDIESYKEKKYTFKYIIADEAQYLKNSQTQNAKAIKTLNGETRFALTGTPIENSLAELWSIFDYIMPGYLFQYKKFKALYEVPIVKDDDKTAMNKLKMLIEPFILRRNKKEVLTELPDKTITVLNNTMEEEQEKIYMSYLVKAKQDIADEIFINGFEKSQIKILAALTRLRQICCHPSLFLSDYKGGSSKLTQCIEIIEDAISAGHKILLFSGYTSMFPIIQEELNKRNIKYLKLTGDTKVKDRIDLVDKFNLSDDIKIFLISLKAGGTGLNLTSADMVIHYDPWWNVSTENQATDRAHRIGQKNNVQVYKLITNNSIEEKIYELQQKKSELIDNVLSTQTSFISKFSKEEIMQLFEI